ncbi:hypothetical protein ACLMAJ_12850 [Nocardia sp. KC 131]|uniref:hypothetical protein n=1 Tax=Nocardia arseniciresistens TaxID=3392119 RepID=UPI00398EE2B6
MGTMAVSGVATADPGARSDHTSSGRNTNGHADTTGMHRIDPYGYNHFDTNPLWQNEHRENLRQYHQRQNRVHPPENLTARHSGSQSWTQMVRPDGSGWTVCPPRASWC